MKSFYKIMAIGSLCFPLSSMAAQWGLGVGAIVTDSAYLGQTQDPIVLPLLTYEGERFSFGGLSANYLLFANDVINIKATLGPGMDFFDPDDADDPRMSQIKKRDFSLLAGVAAEMDLGLVSSSLALGHDVTGHSNGYSLEWAVKKNLMLTDVLMLQPELGVSYMDAKSADYYYGVANGESNSFAAYKADNAVNPYVALSLTYEVTRQWQFYAMTKLTRLDTSISDSPIVENKQNLMAVLALSYKF